MTTVMELWINHLLSEPILRMNIEAANWERHYLAQLVILGMPYKIKTPRSFLGQQQRYSNPLGIAAMESSWTKASHLTKKERGRRCRIIPKKISWLRTSIKHVTTLKSTY